MKIAILGAGFTGLSSALKLLDLGHSVVVIEKESDVGGLASGFIRQGWKWSLEKGYHHWFTNDEFVLNLAKSINYQVITVRPKTDIFVNGRIYPFDSPLSLLKFPQLPIIDRLKLGFYLFYLKSENNYHKFESIYASSWLKTHMGQKVYQTIWEPLFKGKFGDYAEKISLTWFWARIKKRTPSLSYPAGGYKQFATALKNEVVKRGGEILLETEVLEISSQKSEVRLEIKKSASLKSEILTFDKVIVTLPSPIFAKVTPGLTKKYVDRITSIPHLNSLNLILILKKPFLNKTYWLNINEPDFPFLVLAEHTNFMDPKNYNHEHILYIGNYLPRNHPYLKMTAKELLKIFDPYLQKIHPNYQQLVISSYQFIGHFAQPVATVGYQNLMPEFVTPLKNIYLANMDMVYPWDRGTNYAVEMGEQIAEIINKEV